MGYAIYTFLFLAGISLIYWLRVRPFREKKTNEPERSIRTKLIGRQVVTGTHRSGRSSGMGYSYVLTFRTDAGEDLKLYCYDVEYGALREGMTGLLTWKGPYFVSFLNDAA